MPCLCMVSQPVTAVLLALPSRSLQVTITNFSLSKLLVSEDELLRDQRGSLAYISPDVLSGEKTQMHAVDFAKWSMQYCVCSVCRTCEG